MKAVSTCSPATGRLRADPGEQLLRDLLRGLLNDRLYGICPLGFAEGMAVYGLFPRINAGQSPKRAVARTGAYKAGRGLIKGALYGPDVSALLRIRAAGRCTLPVRPIGRKEHKGSLYGGTVTLRVDSLLHTRQSRGDSGARRPHPSSLRSSGSLTASLALLAHSLSVGVLQPIPYSLRSVRSSTVGSCSTAEPFAGPGSAQPPRDRPAAPAVVSAAPCAAERTTSAITAEVVRARRPRRSRDAS